MRRPVPEYPWLSAVQCTTRIRSVSSDRLVKSGAADRAGRGGAVEAAVEPPIRGEARCALRSGRHNVDSIHATTSVTSPRRPRRHAGVVKNHPVKDIPLPSGPAGLGRHCPDPGDEGRGDRRSEIALSRIGRARSIGCWSVVNCVSRSRFGAASMRRILRLDRVHVRVLRRHFLVVYNQTRHQPHCRASHVR
jgi:hypothetical protein